MQRAPLQDYRPDNRPVKELLPRICSGFQAFYPQNPQEPRLQAQDHHSQRAVSCAKQGVPRMIRNARPSKSPARSL